MSAMGQSFQPGHRTRTAIFPDKTNGSNIITHGQPIEYWQIHPDCPSLTSRLAWPRGKTGSKNASKQA
jgi:hypothetical protein